MESKQKNLVAILLLVILMLFGFLFSSFLTQYLFPGLSSIQLDNEVNVNKYFLSIFISQACVFLIPSLIWLKRMKLNIFKFQAMNTKQFIWLIPLVLLVFLFVYSLNEWTINFFSRYAQTKWMTDLLGQQATLFNQLFSAKNNLLFAILVVGILPAIGEELFFRKIIFGYFSKQQGRFWRPAIISSLLFALMHFQPALIIPICLLAITFCFLYQLSNSILPGIILHATNNTIQILIIHYQLDESFLNWNLIGISSLLLSVLITFYYRKKIQALICVNV